MAPPPPPQGSFAARLAIPGMELVSDIRPTGISERTYVLDYQASSGNGPIRIAWNASRLDSLGVFTIVDDVTGELFGPYEMTSNDGINLAADDPKGILNSTGGRLRVRYAQRESEATAGFSPRHSRPG